jgi:hypothetical protein
MSRRFFMMLAGAALALGCSRAMAEEPGPVLKAFSLFTYQAPSGWTSQVAGGLTLGGFPQAVGPTSNNFTPDITFVTNGYHSIDDFVKSYKPRLIDLTPRAFPLKLVDTKPFVTAAGVKGMRLHSIDPASPPIAEQFSYVFPNPDGMVFEFACACAPADAARLLPIFDASMKSVKILRTGE